jgi:hypothetical protein
MCMKIGLSYEGKNTDEELDMRFPQWWLQRLLSSVKCHRAVQYKFTDISGGHTASVFKDEEEDKQVKGKEAEECLLLSSCLLSLV